MSDTRKYHWKPAKTPTSSRAITRGTLRRRATATRSSNAPRVASTGLYHGTARCFRLNWATTRTGPSRQAPRPAQKYVRPCERWFADEVVAVATVVMLESPCSGDGKQERTNRRQPPRHRPRG